MPDLTHDSWTDREIRNLSEVTRADVDAARRSFRKNAKPPFNKLLDAIPSTPVSLEELEEEDADSSS